MADNIAQYNSPIKGIEPSERGSDALAHAGRIEAENYDQAGRAYGQAAETVGSTVQYMQEVSQGSAGLAVMHNNLATGWNKLAQSTDPNDTTIQQQFMDQANDQINQWQDGFNTKRGQEWAMNQADAMRSHLWDRTSADMGNRAGAAIVGNMKTTLNNLSETAYQDPTTIDQALGHVDAIVAASKESANGFLGQGQIDSINTLSIDSINTLSADMKNEIVKSGLKGLADTNPKAMSKALDSGAFKDYLSQTEVQQLQNYADVQAHGKEVDKTNAAKMQQQKQVQASDKANGQYLGALTQGKIPSATQIISDPNLTTKQKSMWVARDGILSMPPEQLQTASLGNNFAGAAQAVYSSKGVTSDGLLAGIRRGEISPAGAAQLQKLQAMQKTPEGLSELAAQKSVLTNVQTQLVKGGPYAGDPAGQQRYNAFMSTFYSSWDQAIKGGATPAELADPSSPKYIGNLATQFKRTDAQAISDVMTNAKQQNAVAPVTAPTQAKNWVIKDGKLVPAGAQ